MIRIFVLLVLNMMINVGQPRHMVDFYANFDSTPYGTVWDLQVSHDDSTLVVIYSEPMMIQVINLADMSIRNQTEFNARRDTFNKPILSLQVSHDGEFVFWTAMNNSYLWETSGGELYTNPFNSTDSDFVLDVMFSRDDNRITVSFWDEFGGAARIEGWSIEPLEQLWMQESVKGFLRVISPDNRYVVVEGIGVWLLDWEKMGEVITIAQSDSSAPFPDHFARFMGGFFHDPSRFTYIYVSSPSDQVFLTNAQSITLSPTLSRDEPIELPTLSELMVAPRHYDQSGRYVGLRLQADDATTSTNVLFDLQDMQIERDLSDIGIIHTGIGVYIDLNREPYTLIDFINNEEITLEYNCNPCGTLLSGQGRFLVGWNADHIEIWRLSVEDEAQATP